MEIETIGMIILFVVILIVGVSIVASFISFKTLVPTQLSDVYNKVVTSIGFKSPYNLCQSFSGSKISLQDFQTLLQAVYNGQCGNSHANVSLSFALTKQDLQRIAAIDGIAFGGKLIFYNVSSPLGVGAVLVQGDPGQYPLKLEDFLDIYASGSPTPDVLIKVVLKGCDPYDDVCDASCLFKGICDPACDDGQRHNIPCNLACIVNHDITSYSDNSINGNNSADRIVTGKCNPDCYSNVTNPFKAYDPGCVWKFRNQNDDICDPNSNGIKDGVCDPDCVKTKNICDPDCDGTVYEGNPFGLNDTKCFVCDQTCNGWCSPACNKNALPGEPGFDPDCYKKLNSSYFCSGDGICDASKGENCANSIDCPGGGLTCGDYHSACCPTAANVDVSGCTNTTNLNEGGACTCGTQCATGLVCDKTSHCCQEGKIWNGTACEFTYTFTILYIQLNGKINNLQSQAEAGKNLWVSLSPLKSCPGRVQEIAVPDKICQVPNQAGICGGSSDVFTQTMQGMLDCADSWGYKGIYTRVIGVLPGDIVCSIGNGYILGYTDIYAESMVTAENNILETSSHEMGHTFGLCDEGYGIASCPDCNTRPNGICSFGGMSCYPQTNAANCKASGGYVCPEVPEYGSIHCSANVCSTPCSYAPKFSQSATEHLQKELSKYCK